jgi:aminoglycoside phosphotransferase (APT) family kinase protein
MKGRPPTEHPIGIDLVRGLVQDQHPDLADMALTRLAEGWDNELYRLGPHLVLRLPRREASAALIRTEQRWLPELAADLPIPVPTPVRIGRPGRGYPWRWSITPWLPGVDATQGPLRREAAPKLGDFLRVLHRPAPAEAPYNPDRSITLADRAPRTEATLARLEVLRPKLITREVRRAWIEGVTAEIDLPAVWIHGDLHGLNVLTQQGRLCGVIDWGDMARGDPATDLYGLWLLLPDRAAREAALAAYGGVSQATLQRARGWAVSLGAVLIEAGLINDPVLAVMGEHTLRALEEGP